MPAITTHVLDISQGRPLANIPVQLEILQSGLWTPAAGGSTDADGRLRLLEEAVPAIYRITFELADGAFYPVITIHFAVRDARHHHIPLLLSPFGYSTYRGS